MTDYGKNNQNQAPSYAYSNAQPRGNETALMIEGLYNGLTYDLQKMKKELMNELKYNALQASSLYQSVQKETNSATETNAQTAQSLVRELKYGYQQNQMIYESLSSILTDDVLAKLETVEGKVELLERIDQLLAEIKEKLDSLDGDALAETVKEKIIEVLSEREEIDYDKITESVAEKTESTVATHNKEVLDAVAAIPVAENVDYARIVEEVSDKVLEKLREALPKVTEETAASDIDYDRIIYGAAEKVVESLPYPEKLDYNRMDENFMKAAETVKSSALDEEVLAANVASAVAQAISEMNVDAFAEAVAAKIVLPETKTEELDYDKLSDMIIAKLPAPVEPEPVDYELLAEAVIAKMPVPVEPEPIDYEKLAEAVIARMSETIDYDKISETVAERMPAPETLDYAVMAQNIAERMPVAEQSEAIDYDKMYQAAKAAETIPDPVDYDRIAEIVESGTANEIDYDIVVDEEGKKEIAEEVAKSLDYETLSEKVAEKVVLPSPEKLDYELLVEMLAERLSVQPEPPTYDVVVDEDGAKSIAECVAAAIDFETVTDKLAEKVKIPSPEIVLPESEALDYDVLSDKVAEKITVPQTEIDYETLSDGVADKITVPSFDILVDEEGAEKIADAVVEKLHDRCPAVCSEETSAEESKEEETVEALNEEAVEEQPVEEYPSEKELSAEEVEEPVAEESAEEAVGENEEEELEAPSEEAIEEQPVEMVEEVAAAEEEIPVEETAGEEAEILSRSEATIDTEIAVTAAETALYEEVDNNLVDADTGLVLRLKRSFTAKMKQSEPTVKRYYSDLKNELTSYKRLNSNLSWHGDRFNFGRDTVARINICGKTLCFYLALDPNNEEYKTTVYHQRDMSSQKAYENTPFMVKVKSDAALKKALRLVGFLAAKLGTEKRTDFEAIDYAEEFRHESTKQLLEEGLIKVTKEKKVVLDFN